MNDSQIVALYWARDEAALSESAVKYGAYCRTIAQNILHSDEDADETVNDTWLGAWNAMPPHRPSVLSTFLGKITRRLSMKRWRARDTRKRGGGETALALDELMDCVPDGRAVDERLEAEELARVIDGFLAALPPAERQIFVRRYWYMASVSEICRQYGYSKSKTESMLFRTRKKLLIRLNAEGVFL